MKKQFVIFPLIAVVVLLAVIAVTVKKHTPEQPKSTAEVSSGVEMVKQMESRDAAAVQAELDLRAEEAAKKASEAAVAAVKEKNLSEEEIAKLKFKKIFSDSIVIGDSIVGGFLDYDCLKSSQIVFKTGISTPSAKEYLLKAKKMNPKNVFLYFGANDISHDHYNYEKFQKDYEAMLATAKEIFPDAKIYSIAIFPATKPLTKKQVWYTKVDEYNKVMQKACEKYQIPYLDCTDFMTKDYFQPDGFHLISKAYPLWLYRMAKGAGLL